MEKLLLDIPTAAARIGVGRTLFYELIGRGDILTVRVGRRVLVPSEALKDFVQRRIRESVGEEVA
jgi:excisionase family DNA binding protein